MDQFLCIESRYRNSFLFMITTCCILMFIFIFLSIILLINNEAICTLASSILINYILNICCRECSLEILYLREPIETNELVQGKQHLDLVS